MRKISEIHSLKEGDRIKQIEEKANFQMMTVYFFLHEMYHIIGFGERDATTKASKIMSRIFGQRVLIPEHKIKR